MAEPLVLVDDDRDRGPGRADLAGRATAFRARRATARVEIFSAKTRVTPEAFSESVWVSSDWRAVEARAFCYRSAACPAGVVPADAGRGGSIQAKPGLRSGGTGTARALARRGTSRNRAVWYCAATLPRLVRHDDQAGAAQDDIGQGYWPQRGGNRRRSPRRSFHGFVAISSSRMQRPMKRGRPEGIGPRPVSQVTACETGSATAMASPGQTGAAAKRDDKGCVFSRGESRLPPVDVSRGLSAAEREALQMELDMLDRKFARRAAGDDARAAGGDDSASALPGPGHGHGSGSPPGSGTASTATF